jgi:AhpC/TSA family
MMVVISYGETEVEIDDATWRDGDLWLPLEGLPSAIGWDVSPEGVCAGELCVPVPPGAMWSDGEHFNVSAFARHIGLAEAADAERGLVGYEAPRRAPAGPGTVEAPNFTLPELDGNLHSLSDYRGQKVVLLTWASY